MLPPPSVDGDPMMQIPTMHVGITNNVYRGRSSAADPLARAMGNPPGWRRSKVGGRTINQMMHVFV